MNDSLLEKFESYGGFWLPNNDNQIVSGQLKLDPDGTLELILSDDLNNTPDSISVFQRGERIPIIFGQLVNGMLVTLVDAMPLRRTFGFGPGGPLAIVINLAFLGTHFVAIEDLRIISFETTFTLLEQWAGHTNISSEYKMAADGITKTEWMIHCGFPPDEVFRIKADAIAITLSQQLDFHAEQNGFSVRPISFFRIVPDSPVTFEETKHIRWNLQNLITLLTGQPVAPRFLHLEIDKPDERLRTATTSVVFLCLITLKKPTTESFEEALLVPLRAVRPQFEQILNQWFRVVKRSKIALDVSFGALYQPATVLNLRFLAVTQALESYHRSFGNAVYMDETLYKTLIEKLKEQIPVDIDRDHRESLKRRLQYGNEFSLRKRLSLLIKALPADIQTMITLNPSNFVEHVVATRNQFTHYNAEPDGDIFDPSEVLWASERLRILLTATMLLDIGIPTESLHDILIKHNGFKTFIYGTLQFVSKNS